LCGITLSLESAKRIDHKPIQSESKVRSAVRQHLLGSPIELILLVIAAMPFRAGRADPAPPSIPGDPAPGDPAENQWVLKVQLPGGRQSPGRHEFFNERRTR
jgi:hypothetical protein